VLWGISPEGRATNLGEIVLKHGKATVKVTERLQTFGLVVTAEPYFAVSQPSDVVVMDNDLSPELKGKIELVDTKYELLKRGQYAQNLDSPAAMAMDSKTPFEVYQARNAVRIARATGAAAYAPEAYGKAADYLQRAETEDASKAKVVMAREAVQRAEDARLIAVQKQDSEQTILDEKLAKARLDKARDEAAATAAANDRLKAKLDESRRETAAAGASEDAALKAARLAEAENEGLRDRLRVQLNAILQTRATARGLIVNMSGVLFENGKSALVPAAREKLAKIAGILSTHKGLRIEADGFTDSVGSEESNQRLSEQRAQSARDYLVAQGVAADHISVKGFGEANPIASNETSAGRQENRRVELVVSGAGITAAKAAGM
jgi:outer membrane protein OmpA-like peptidoglycan-associated protein